MKPCYMIIAIAFLFVLCTQPAGAQAFRKGSLLISVSEGATFSHYTTYDTRSNSDVIGSQGNNGDRDPLSLEFGLSDRWGIGLTSGGDIYKVNSAVFYNYETSSGTFKAITGEFTADAYYHFYVTKRVDLSGFASLGLSGICIQGNDGDRSYEYKAGGGMIRLGAKGRYYVLRRLGVMGMVSTFSTKLSPEGAKNNTMGKNISTTIQGCALEFGLCYRVLR